MSNAIIALPAAAWHADPIEPGQYRWWDGASWTDHTSRVAGMEHDVGQPVLTLLETVEPAAFVESSSDLSPTTERAVDPNQPLTRREWRNRQAAEASAGQVVAVQPAAVEPVAVEPNPLAVSTAFVPFLTALPEPDYTIPSDAQQPDVQQSGAPGVLAFAGLTPSLPSAVGAPSGDALAPYDPMATNWAATSETPVGSSQTAAGWILAVAPIWLGAAFFAYYLLLPNYDGTPIGWGLRVALIIAALGLAKWDAATLRARGFHKTPVLGLVVLLPLYFVIRAVRLGRNGIAPLLVHLAVLAGVSAAVYWVFDTGFLVFTY